MAGNVTAATGIYFGPVWLAALLNANGRYSTTWDAPNDGGAVTTKDGNCNPGPFTLLLPRYFTGQRMCRVERQPAAPQILDARPFFADKRIK